VGVAKVNETLRGVTGFQVVEKRIKIDDAGMSEYRVRLRLSFDMAPETELHW
jgi:flavin-binding protein dodecin